eukprot:TRINITY_DN101244_c0_g1_i1.p1 TRINITY_DN101244_c0_g1~~TRINITY_DN101244_c0_g1_i1.p1  ORF type:complete len:200 (+),score=71.57 TRINITY_DN101244_c0_g1_i1:90-689(+)
MVEVEEVTDQDAQAKEANEPGKESENAGDVANVSKGDKKADDSTVKKRVVANSSIPSGSRVTDSTAKFLDGEEIEEADMDDELRRALARQRSRRKTQSKRLQYNFLFKTGAFLVMLVIVLISKQIQKYTNPEGAGSNETAKKKLYVPKPPKGKAAAGAEDASATASSTETTTPFAAEAAAASASEAAASQEAATKGDEL